MSKQILFVVPAYPPYFISGAQVHAKAIVDFLVEEKNAKVFVSTTQACSPEDFWQRRKLKRDSLLIEENIIRWPIRYLPFHRLVFGISRPLVYATARVHGPAVLNIYLEYIISSGSQH